jgi:hypothetical protein
MTCHWLESLLLRRFLFESLADDWSPNILENVIGLDKRRHFVQNAIFCHFLTCHHFKPVRALGFWFGMIAVETFYFTDLTLEATASLLSRAVSRQSEASNGNF